MGQPTSGLGQRTNRTQLPVNMSVLSHAERGFGEHQFRLVFCARFAVLCFQSLILPGHANMWFRRQRGLQLYAYLKWEYAWQSFPNLQLRQVRKRYFETKKSRFLLFDGERSYKTIAYKHRKLRFATVFWCQPRIFRLGSSLLFVLRGYNVTSPQVRYRRVKRRQSRRALGWLRVRALPVPHALWF